jgi:hypothetical protein
MICSGQIHKTVTVTRSCELKGSNKSNYQSKPRAQSLALCYSQLTILMRTSALLSCFELFHPFINLLATRIITGIPAPHYPVVLTGSPHFAPQVA